MKRIHRKTFANNGNDRTINCWWKFKFKFPPRIDRYINWCFKVIEEIKKEKITELENQLASVNNINS